MAWHDTQPMNAEASALGLPPLAVVISYRLGGADGVSTEATKWVTALRSLGWVVRTVAGDGAADHLLAGLAGGAALNGRPAPPLDEEELGCALDGADLVVVENLCSLPLNPSAGEAVARALKGRRAILRHHDLAWQRARFASSPPPPDDPAWLHVAVTDQARSDLARRGLKAVTMRNRFDPHPPEGDRQATRRALRVADCELLVVQPTRAIRRKGIGRALALAEGLGATYWLVGETEEGYDEELEAMLAVSRARCLRGRPAALVTSTAGIEHAYAAADLVVFPSSQEGFGNPPVEASLHMRPVAVGPYAPEAEMRALGFRWLDAYRLEEVRDWLRAPVSADLAHNARTARRWLDIAELPGRLAELLSTMGLPCPAAMRARPLPAAEGGSAHAGDELSRPGR